jgi:hypothetical protein
VIEDRPYGIHLDYDRSEDCTLSIDSVTGPTAVANFSLVPTGAWLSDPASNTSEIFVFQKGMHNKEVLKFNSIEDLRNDTIADKYILPFPWTGTGHAIYAGALYYVKANSATVVR